MIKRRSGSTSYGSVPALVKHMRELGHTRIGFIGGSPKLLSAQLRKQAILSCAGKMGSIEIRTVDSDFTVQGGYFACAQLLSGWNCTALIAANDLMAIGAMHCVYDRGISVPKQMSIIGFDDITFAQFTQPALTTVAVPRSEIGSVAFEALSKMLSDSKRQGSEYRVKTNLIIRNSTAPCE